MKLFNHEGHDTCAVRFAKQIEVQVRSLRFNK